MVLSISMAELGAGSRIGAYRIVRKLGDGGMGAVFEAIHATIERHVAIKVLHSEYAVRQDVVGRFFNEARAANLIDHPSIVQVSDFGYTEHGTAYIVMEYLRGEALSKRLHKGALPCATAVHIARAIAGALVAAHDKNIVHRDLKPDNVMLIPDPEHPGEERLKLLDFGIAKLMESEHASHVKTRTNVVMGTPAYMSPEQCKGASYVDAQSDVYSLGVMLYEMLAGRLPFVAEDSGSLIGMHLFKKPPPLHEVAPFIPASVATLTDQLLHKDKQQRPSMRQLAAQLHELEAGAEPLPMGTGGTWLRTALHTLMPVRTKRAAPGFSSGQFPDFTGERTKRKTFLLAGFVGLVAIGGFLYFVTNRGAPVRPPAISSPGVTPSSTSSPVPIATPPELPASTAKTALGDVTSEPRGVVPMSSPPPLVKPNTGPPAGNRVFRKPVRSMEKRHAAPPTAEDLLEK